MAEAPVHFDIVNRQSRVIYLWHLRDALYIFYAIRIRHLDLTSSYFFLEATATQKLIMFKYYLVGFS